MKRENSILFHEASQTMEMHFEIQILFIIRFTWKIFYTVKNITLNKNKDTVILTLLKNLLNRFNYF